MREAEHRPERGRPRTEISPLMALAIALVGVFVVQNLLPARNGHAQQFLWNLGLSVNALGSGKLWTLLTYGFLHEPQTLWHIGCNLLGLYFFGRVTLPMLGAKRFWIVWFAAEVLGGLAWLGTSRLTGHPGLLIGASASVCALFVVFALLAPDRPLRFLLFFFIPIVARPRQFAVGVLVFEALGLLAAELPSSSGIMNIAHSAHLGGMAAGWLCVRLFAALDRRALAAARPDIEEPAWWRRVRSRERPGLRATVNLPPADLHAEVDRILDKISRDGFRSLTDAERQTLDAARDHLKPR